jgi:hypothetical protein
MPEATPVSVGLMSRVAASSIGSKAVADVTVMARSIGAGPPKGKDG